MFSELPGASPPGPTGGLQRPKAPAQLSNRDLTQMRIGGQRTAFKIHHCTKCNPGIGSMGKSMEFMGDHCFIMLPMLPLLSHALQKHGEAWKAWEYFQATSAEHGLAWKPWDITFL